MLKVLYNDQQIKVRSTVEITANPGAENNYPDNFRVHDLRELT